ncbi:hypothetical protein ASG01_08825 [Chryseobacterium sp. Leaf180]|uniref:hypothetical protein n=1 Tax=Chryseobacterium sp. Leaf180 TaxID=1736289 RepID=UPI0006FBC475|nr:hypothetical protein [Chryseobacterium sp. Leaf180]KQR93290.1 hypothetical protein ASG01_08825 [Chryseobacterium sp. Leaf180]
MTHEEALLEKRNFMLQSNGLAKENMIYIIPEIVQEGNAFLQLVFRNKIKYSDYSCKDFSSNGQFLVFYG